MRLFADMFRSKRCPIGVDLGSDTIKLAQAAPRKDGSRELIAAAAVPVPPDCRRDVSGRIAFFQASIRTALGSGGFRGTQVVLSLPASCMFIERLRLPRMEEDQLKQSVLWEARGKLPIDPTAALLRHVVAGEVYQEQEPVNEVIVMGCARELMNRFLSAAARAKLDVVGMTAEPQATVDCFAYAQAGTPQARLTRMYVDIGLSGTRVYIARGPHLLFARTVPLGAEHFDQAVMSELKIPLDQARQQRRDRAAGAASGELPPAQAKRSEPREAARGGGTALAAPPARTAAPKLNPIDAACAKPLRALIDELERCIRYHEHTFPSCPVEQVTFIGGEANDDRLCRQISVALSLPVTPGDPLARLVNPNARIANLDISRRQPALAVAVGLTIGTVA